MFLIFSLEIILVTFVENHKMKCFTKRSEIIRVIGEIRITKLIFTDLKSHISIFQYSRERVLARVQINKRIESTHFVENKIRIIFYLLKLFFPTFHIHRNPHVPSHTCITYDAINAAYVDARKRIRVAQPKGEWKPEDIATVGELLLDMSIQLSRT